MGQYPRFPLFIDLTGQKVVLVGGGTIALRRARTLLQFGAQVVVIAPTLHPDMPPVTHVNRPYQPGDLDGATLAVAATDCRETNRQVGQEAHTRSIPVSVADDPSACTFFFPAVCLGDGVVAGVVGDGSDHARTARCAGQIREILEETP